MAVITPIDKRPFTSLADSNPVSAENFFQAIHQGDVKTVEIYLKAGGNANCRVKAYGGGTIQPLKSLAGQRAWQGTWTAHHEEIFRLLVNHGADVNTVGDKVPLLHSAIYQDAIEFFSLLLDSKDINLEATRDGETALMCACKCNRRNKFVEMLLKKKANPNYMRKIDSGYESCLSVALWCRHLLVVQSLLKHQANPNLELPSVYSHKFKLLLGPVTAGYFAFASDASGLPFYEGIHELIKYGAIIDSKCTLERIAGEEPKNLWDAFPPEKRKELEDALVARKAEKTLAEENFLPPELARIVGDYIRV